VLAQPPKPNGGALALLGQLERLEEPEVAEVADVVELPDRDISPSLHDELAAARAETAAATAEVERLRERVRILESWLAAAAQGRNVEYMQAQRLALKRALDRDERYTFVLSLPLVLLLCYSAALGVVIWLLLADRV
jgi:hypothetical protein